MKNIKDLLLPAMGLLPLTAGAQAADGNSEQTTQRPNIIFILCDDMGYGDLGCYGQQRIETPNLDRMAAEGMRFTQAYAGSPVSAPSRASLMTGQHTGHTHVRGNREYWQSAFRQNMFGDNGDYGIIGQEPYLNTHKIIPEVMKEAGYTTGMFGKWAAGYYNMDYPDTYAVDANGNTDTSKSATSSSNSLPNTRGIDCYYGYICQFQAHTYYPNFLNRYDPEKYGDEHVEVHVLEENIKHKAVYTGDKDYENRSQYTSDLIHQYALDWIDRQDDQQPFLGIFTYTLPHAELWQPQDELVAKYTEKFAGDDSNFGGNFGSWYYLNENRHAQFAAMVERLDIQVGEIFAKLEEKGLDDNTLVIFTSDNGPHQEGGADPAWFNQAALLQGTKRSTHEGGIRVPFIAKGPGVPAGTVNDHQLAFYDVMPTLLDYAGLDGTQYSLEASTEADYFDGISFKETLTGNDEAQEKHEFLYWEFHETNMMALRMGDWKLVVQGGSPRLYDLATDLHEDIDVAAQHPDVVKEMIEIIHREHTNSSLFSVTLPAIPEEAPASELTFVRDGQNVTVNSAVSGATAEFVNMTINGNAGSFKASTGSALTNEVLCPDVNANTNPTIKMTFKLKGLTSLNSIGLTLLGLNSGGNYQNADNFERTWTVVCGVGNSADATTEVATFEQDVTKQGGDAVFTLSKELDAPVELPSEGAYLTLTITNKTTTGCFLGISAISLTGDNSYIPLHTGTRTSEDRKINTISLSGSFGDNSTTLTHTGNGLQYVDLTQTETMKVAAGETVTAGVTLVSGHWINAYTYIDLDGDGFTAALADDGYTPTGDLMAYSFYTSLGGDNAGYNSAGTPLSGGARNTLSMPSFKAPTEAGTYRMRFKTDWNDIQPDGSGEQFVSAWGTIVDITLVVEDGNEEETPTIYEYTIDKTNGNLYRGESVNQSWNSAWKSDATPQLQFGCGPNNMNWEGDNVQLMTGTAGTSTYTLTAPSGYVITEYSFTFANNGHDTGLSLTMDNGAAYTTSTTAQTVSANNLKTSSVSFVLAGNNGNGVVLTDFTVKVKKDVVETVKISTEGNEYWYYITSASTKNYCAGKVIYYDGETGKLRFGDKAFTADRIWSFWENDGKLAIKNYRGEYFGTAGAGTGGSTSFGVVDAPNYIYNISSAHGFYIIKDNAVELHAQEANQVIVRWAAEAGGASLWKFDEVDVSNAAAEVAYTRVVQGKISTGIGNTDQPIVRSTIRIGGLEGTVNFQGVKGTFSGTDKGDITHVKAYFATNARELFIDPEKKMAWREENGEQFGATVTLAEDGTFTINGSRDLAPGDNYLWIAYDIAEDAKEGNLVDATITSYTIDGEEVAESNGDPAHSATIFLSEGAVLMPMDKGSRYYRIPSITVTRDGKRLVTLTDDRKAHGADLPSHCYLVAQYSEDNGKTWSEPVTVAGTAATGGNYGHGDASIVTNRDNGEIVGIMTSAGTYGHGFFAGTAAEPPRWKTITSRDGGLTWSTPVDHTDDLFGANCDNPKTKTWKSGFSGSGAALQKRDGTLVSSFVNRQADNSQHFYFFMSKDGGKNWYVSGTSGTSGADEPKTLERNNGDLAISVRAGGYNYHNYTSDDGATWHLPSQTRFTTGISGNACDGEYMVWCSTVEGNPWNIAFQTLPNHSSRQNVSIALSTDEGSTFGTPKTICPRGSAYSAAVVLPDGTLGVYYEENGVYDGFVMRFVRFSLDWASDGKYKFTEEAPFYPIKSTNPSSIEELQEEHAGSRAIYDLMGRPVTNPTKGVYIVNGKKVSL